MSATKYSSHSSRVNYRIVIAIVLSLLLHLALLSKFGFPSKSGPTKSSTLQVRLNPQLPLTANKVVSTPAAPTKPQTPVIQPTEGKPPVQKPKQPARDPLKPEQPIAQRSETPNLEPVELLTESATETKQTAEEPTLALEAIGTPPRWVEMEFEIYVGQGRKLIDKGLHHFESDDANNYQVSFKQMAPSDINSKSKVLQSGEPWQLQINGSIYRHGLGPSVFNYQGLIPEQLLTLSSSILSKESEKKHLIKSGRFPDAILDSQSLMYQFMFTPPKPSGEILLTDGSKITAFNYHVVGLGIIDSEPVEINNIGTVKTLHIIFTDEKSAEMIELWVAPNMRYLPVKLRYTNTDGLLIEELATMVNIK